MRVFRQHPIHHFIIRLQIPIQILLLHKIQPYSLIPVQVTNFGEDILIHFVIEYLEAEEYEADGEVWVLCVDLGDDLVAGVHI